MKPINWKIGIAGAAAGYIGTLVAGTTAASQLAFLGAFTTPVIVGVILVIADQINLV